MTTDDKNEPVTPPEPLIDEKAEQYVKYPGNQEAIDRTKKEQHESV